MEPRDDDELDSHNSRRSPSFKDSAAASGDHDGQLSRAISNRTLLDVIRDDGGTTKEGKRTWRHFKDKLKGHHGNASGGRGSNWTSSVPIPASDIPISNSRNWTSSRHPSARGFDSDPINQADISAVPDARRSTSLIRNPSRPTERATVRFDLDNPMKRLQREEEEREEEEEEDEYDETAEMGGKTAEEGVEEPRPVRMSLMSLLAETDEDGIGYGMDDDDDDDDDDDEGGVEFNNCCICMVRHKGTAFEPCGHSFCRLCSREMWVQGGNCPLCNNYILEILDIF